MQNFNHVEIELKVRPAKALFESWDAFPRRAFGDSLGHGEDYLVLEYVRAHSNRP